MTTKILDALQISLQTPGLNYATAVALFILLITAWKAFWKLWRLTWKAGKEIKITFPKLSIKNGIICAVFVIFVTSYADEISLQIEYVETRYLDPVTTGEFEEYSPDHLTAIYEAELRKNVDPYEFKIVHDSVAAMVRLFQCDSSAIYEAALPECGLNPFVIRKDGVAAGFIQFTVSGCSNMPFKLPDVKRWCYTRNTAAMMQATRVYLQAAKGNRPMKSGLDVYLAVFCPRELGSGPDAVLYDSGLAYSMNANLDGWTCNNGRIYRSPSKVDGKITVGELDLWMRYHKIQLIKSHQNESI